MSVDNVKAYVEGSCINITWERTMPAYAISVQIAKNIEFTNTTRTFVIPDGSGISIDAGNGAWFYRVGIWFGAPFAGTINWSTMYGPAIVTTPKLSIGIKPSSLRILHTQAIEKGLRIHTGITTPYYVVADVAMDSPSIMSVNSTTQFAYDTGKGYVDIVGLNYAHTYSIRIATFVSEPSLLPTDAIKPLSAGLIVLNQRPARQLRKLESGLSTTAKADTVMLKDLARQSRLSFNSHADYIKYVAAKAKTSEEVNRADHVRP